MQFKEKSIAMFLELQKRANKEIDEVGEVSYRTQLLLDTTTTGLNWKEIEIVCIIHGSKEDLYYSVFEEKRDMKEELYRLTGVVFSEESLNGLLNWLVL